MNRKERARMTVMKGVTDGRLTLVQAAELMGVGYRQSKRIWRRYQAGGDAGLVHRLRGRPSGRRKPAGLRAQVLALYGEERYADFGPTLMSEHLAKQKLVVDHETLRRWRIAQGRHLVRRRRQAHRQWRERKPSFGAMVQLDGSHHDWFEGRGPRCVLMVMVDDATNRMRARFFAEETTRASYDVLEGWIRRHGVPASLYVDRDSIYRCEGEPSLAQQLAGEEPRTQFGRAMEQLGVELILANSPQAKGRVERMNGTLQDRLVKEMRLAGISDMESANRYLEGKYLRAFHRRFGRAAASPVDVHGEVPRNLDEVLSWEAERVVQNDWTVACDGQRYQLDRRHEALTLVRRKVIVRTLRDGRVQLVHQGRPLRWRRLPAGAERKARPARAKPARAPRTKAETAPPADHPWRRFGAAAGRRFWNKVQAEAGKVRAAPPKGAGLRSASAPLRPPYVPHPRPTKPTHPTTANQRDILS